MSKTFEFIGDDQTIHFVMDYLREHGCRVPPWELECGSAKGKKEPKSIGVTICETVVKLAIVYATLMTEKKVEITFESDSEGKSSPEILTGHPGDSPEKLEIFLQKHTKISVRF